MTQTARNRPRLLLTRPQAAAERFARQFTNRFGADWPVTIAPLMAIRPLAVTEAAAVQAADALIFTSQHAIAPVAGAVLSRGRRAFCVGGLTAAAARAAGFEVCAEAEDAAALLRQILAAPARGTLLHARGNESAFPLAARLAEAGRNAGELVVYAQHPQPPSPEAVALLNGTAPLLVAAFSPNSARLLAQAARQATAPLALAAISPAAALACDEMPTIHRQIAPRPDAEGMLEAFAALLA